MAMKAGMTDKGKATADTKVARTSRKNNHTTKTASNAPSYNKMSEARYSSFTGVTKSNAVVKEMPGCAWRNSSKALNTASPTSTSLVPRLRATSKPTTGLPFKKAEERCSATVSLMVAMSRKRISLPLPTANSMSASSAAELTVAKVRMDCSKPPKSVRPPELSPCTWRNCRDTSATVKCKACKRKGSSAISTCRFAPPTRVTAPTPLTASKRRVTVWSTNQLKPSLSKSVAAMVKAKTGPPVNSSLRTIGSSKSGGKSPLTPLTAERTSSSASCTDFSIRNSQVMSTLPSWILVYRFFKPETETTAFSIFRATSVSICTGAAPGKAAVMTMVGKSKSGKFCTFIWLKDNRPAKVSNTNNTTEGTGLRIDQAETFMAWQQRGYSLQGFQQPL